MKKVVNVQKSVRPFIRTSSNFKDTITADDFEHPVGESMTVPDQAMSLRTILERYTQGLPLTNVHMREPLYSDEEFPDLDRMDLSEIQELRDQTKYDIQRLDSELKKRRKVESTEGDGTKQGAQRSDATQQEPSTKVD